MKQHLVVTVRAHARCDLAEILRLTRPKAENHHHELIAAMAPLAATHPSQVIIGQTRGQEDSGTSSSTRAPGHVTCSPMAGDAGWPAARHLSRRGVARGHAGLPWSRQAGAR